MPSPESARLPGAIDVEVFGPSTRHLVVRADKRDLRKWIRDAPVCPLLGQHHISHVGLMRAEPPFEIVRLDQSGTFMLACYEGEGMILAEGEWKRIRAGTACLQPPFVMNALKCSPGKLWKFVWVRYQEARGTRPVASSVSPVTGSFDPTALKAAIEGLHAEASAAGATSALHHWTELVHQYVQRFAQPHQADGRLWRMWQRVETEIGRAWTLPDLAAVACVSDEHLRRLCRKEFGRTPVQHLTFLRLQRARHLLTVTDDKVETIARAVGFESPFSFSNTFKKWVGVRPSDYRQTSKHESA